MRRPLLLGAAILALELVAPANAVTLRDALAQAYQGNPTLTGARAGLRALDEGVPQAKALGRPTLSATTGLVQNFNTVNTLAGARSLTAQLNVGLPIYQGGRVGSAVRAADSRVESGRSSLRGTEAQVFTQVVAAYMNVVRDQRVVALNESNVRVLETNLRASRDRFEVGDLTRTDVAQSEARLAQARSQLISAQAQLTISRENYLQVVGSPAIALEPPPALPNLPTVADAAVDRALQDNPDLLAARANERASGYDTRVARADQLPRLNATGGVAYNNYLGTLDNAVGIPGALVRQEQTTQNVGLTATLPLYQAGAVASRIRQARARESQALEQTIAVERNIVAQARSAFASYQSANAVIVSQRTAVSANTLALEGTRAENSVGTRTVLDVLDAEQELLNSQVSLVAAERDAYVAGFALLAAMGHAEARDLGLDGGALYDPLLNYNRVRGRIGDFATGDPAKVQSVTTYGPAVAP